MADRDPYVVLGVERSADAPTIRAAYRRRAMEWHPDRAGVSSTPRMQQLTAAYRVVGDVSRRSAWDRAHPLRTPDPAPPAGVARKPNASSTGAPKATPNAAQNPRRSAQDRPADGWSEGAWEAYQRATESRRAEHVRPAGHGASEPSVTAARDMRWELVTLKVILWLGRSVIAALRASADSDLTRLALVSLATAAFWLGLATVFDPAAGAPVLESAADVVRSASSAITTGVVLLASVDAVRWAVGPGRPYVLRVAALFLRHSIRSAGARPTGAAGA